MSWVVGIIGFIVGFAAGQMLLLHMLKDRSREELLSDRNLKWKYGTFNWLIAIATCLSFLALYRYYFPA
jgi:hypothetical protein